MIDAPLKQAITEAMTFLRPGGVYRATVNTHEVIIVRISESNAPRRFLVACYSCKALLAAEAIGNHPAFMAVHNHTKPEDEPEHRAFRR